MKYTLLPPQKAPTSISARHPSVSLGEHRRAFMGRNNVKGWVEEPIPEQPQPLEMMALTATLLLANQNQPPKAPAKPKPQPLLSPYVSPLESFKLWNQCKDRSRMFDVWTADDALRDTEYRARRAQLLADSPELFDQTEKAYQNIKESLVEKPGRKYLLGERSEFSYRTAIKEVLNRHTNFNKNN